MQICEFISFHMTLDFLLCRKYVFSLIRRHGRHGHSDQTESNSQKKTFFFFFKRKLLDNFLSDRFHLRLWVFFLSFSLISLDAER